MEVYQLTRERIAAVQELDQTAVRERKLLTQDLNQTALATVDFAFIRAVQLTAAALLALFLGIILLILFTRRVFLSPRIPAGQRPSGNA